MRREYKVARITYNVERITYNFKGARTNDQELKNLQPITYNLQLKKVKHLYDSEIGVKEHGMNSGKRVEEYLRYVNLEKGNPWCAAFICWVFGKAGIDNPRSGWSPDLFKSNVIWKRNSPATNKQTPLATDVFGIWFPEKGRIAHAGFIDRWDKTWLITVEGNTNRDGSREGDGVYRKRRLVRSIYQVARYCYR
ncbi:MAG: peptidoglycan-binding protein [Daejeonella sp.]